MIEGELLIMKGGYLNKRLFNEGISSDTQYKIQTSYPSPEWDWARAHLDYKHRVSQSAIDLSKRIKDELQIDVFPLILTVAIKGHRQDGQMQFKMFGKYRNKEYYFDYSAAKYKKKGYKLTLEMDSFDEVISLEKR